MTRDDEFRRLLEDFLTPAVEPNPQLLGVALNWVRDNPAYGSRHMWEKHRVSESEVAEVLFEIPPAVEARRDPDHPDRWLFLGATRKRRMLLVVCEEEWKGKTRVLTPITAFEADEQEWKRK